MDDTSDADGPPAASRRASHFRFLDLPRELRDEVYDHLAKMAPSVERDRTRDASEGISAGALLALLRTNRQVNDELKDAMYRSARAPVLRVVIQADHSWDADQGRGPFQALLPEAPILEARRIHINILLYTEHFGSLVEHMRGDRRHGCGDPQKERHEFEHNTACLPADTVHLAHILRKRRQLPEISITLQQDDPRYSLQPNLLPAFFNVLRPFRSLCRVPGGVKLDMADEVDSDMDAALPDRERAEFDAFARALRHETSCEGPIALAPELEEKLLRAHVNYAAAREAYEAFEPWIAPMSRVKSAEEVRAERSVRQCYLARWRFACRFERL